MCSSPGVEVADSLDGLAELVTAAPSEQVLAAARRLDPAALDEGDRLLLLQVWDRLEAWMSAQSLTTKVAVAGARPREAEDWARDDVRVALRLTGDGAQSQIDVARMLCGPLAATRAALETGGVSYRQVMVLVEQVCGLDQEVAVAVADRVLARAATQTTGQFRRTVARAITVLAPATAQEAHTQAASCRKVVMYPTADGMAMIAAELTAVGARTVFLALDTLANADSEADPGLGVDARRADALVALCASALADPDLPLRQGRPVQVQVVIDLPTALGLAEHPGELPGYGPIPASAARALAADGDWQALITEPRTGQLLDAGARRYRPSQALRDYILTRSRTCTFPTCAMPATTSEIDHADPYRPTDGTGQTGGDTTRANLGPACKRHHQLKTHHGWTVRAHPDGGTTWTNPHGQHFHSPPHDHRPDRI